MVQIKKMDNENCCITAWCIRIHFFCFGSLRMRCAPTRIPDWKTINYYSSSLCTIWLRTHAFPVEHSDRVCVCVSARLCHEKRRLETRGILVKTMKRIPCRDLSTNETTTLSFISIKREKTQVSKPAPDILILVVVRCMKTSFRLRAYLDPTITIADVMTTSANENTIFRLDDVFF